LLTALLLMSHVVAGAAGLAATGPNAAAPTTPIVSSAGCPGFDALNPLCQAGSVVGGAAGSVASSGINAVLSGLSQWVASGAEWLLSQIGNVLVSTTTIDVGASWFHTHYVEMTALAGVVVLPLLLVSTLQAVYRQNAGQLIRSFLVQLPLALLLGVVAVQIVVLCLSATDAMCAAVAGGSNSDVTALLTGVSNGLVEALADPTMATFVLLLVGLLVAAASFVLWLELLVRAAAVYVAVLFLPMALATLVWPSVSHWCRRLVETLAALILSKFVIVATLSLAAAAISSGTAGTGDAGSGFASVLAGGALLVLATFVPFAILRLIPVVEAGAVGHLEGARHRAVAPLTAVPKTAASFALREGMAAHRDSKGGSRWAAVTGPPGTGGREFGPGGVGPGGGGGGGGVPGGGGARPDQKPQSPADSDGGCVPDANGYMTGISLPGGADPEHLDLPPYEPHPLGPAPIIPATGASTPGASGTGPAGHGAVGQLVPVGRRGHNGLQPAMGWDHMGAFLTYMPEDDAPYADPARPGAPR
jgi:hypothetical protein